MCDFLSFVVSTDCKRIRCADMKSHSGTKLTEVPKELKFCQLKK